ncbi:protein of unknown function [Bradyrhizobium vignae]|uniref:Uncharacterized protein n=1 Tax=Bradyrhizobium vignae TaxID=1549949 RepID=A0A2U3PZ00_9BRAD|nr:protein of unknown function [Bradyrhizobium vignae]
MRTLGRAPYGEDSLGGQTIERRAGDKNNVPYLFQVRNMFFCDLDSETLMLPAKQTRILNVLQI